MKWLPYDWLPYSFRVRAESRRDSCTSIFHPINNLTDSSVGGSEWGNQIPLWSARKGRGPKNLPGPVDLGLIRLPSGAAGGEHEVEAVVLEDGRSLAAAPDEYLHMLWLHVGVVRCQPGYVHVLVALAGVDQVRGRIIVLYR